MKKDKIHQTNHNKSNNYNRGGHNNNARTNRDNNQTSSERGGQNLWIYGKHPSFCAINANRRKIFQILVTANVAQDLEKLPSYKDINQLVEVTTKEKIEAVLGKNITHQGIAVKCSAIPIKDQDDLFIEIEQSYDKTLSLVNQTLPKLLILEQLNDPSNIGAIIRSAAAFGVGKIIFPRFNFPAESAGMVKSSAGAIENIDIITAANTTETIKNLKQFGYFFVALDGDGSNDISDIHKLRNVVLVIGAEGSGVRELVKKNCDMVARINISEVESLNASCAAAIALYELSKKYEI